MQCVVQVLRLVEQLLTRAALALAGLAHRRKLRAGRQYAPAPTQEDLAEAEGKCHCFVASCRAVCQAAVAALNLLELLLQALHKLQAAVKNHLK